MATAFSYLRFSSPRQEWGDSERRQEHLATDYCTKHGLSLSDKSFRDRGVSAWKGANRRGALGELLALLKPGDFLLIEDNDRLSREDPLTAMNLLHSIVLNDVTVITLRDGNRITKNNFFDLSTFLPNIVKGALANEENKKKSMRIKESWVSRRQKMATGKFIGGKIPFWIQKKADGSLALIEERVKVIRRIFDMAYNGMGVRAIMHKLADDEVPTFRANSNWSKNGILYLLGNPAVYGTIQPYIMEGNKRQPIGDPIEDYYPAAITKELFLAVQNKIEQRIHYGGGNTSQGVANLFSGVMKCFKCGGNVMITHKGRKEISYLVCANYHWHHKCTSAILNYIQVEKSLLDYVMKDIKAIEYFSTNSQASLIQKELDEKSGLLTQITKTLAEMSDRAIAEGLPNVLLAKMKALEMRQAALEAECDMLRGKRFECSHIVSFEAITAYIDACLNRGNRARFRINNQGEYEFAPGIPEDRFLIREAFRNYVIVPVKSLHTSIPDHLRLT